MSKAKYDIAPQYLKAEQTRQRYLDYLNQVPGVTANELQQHMADTYGDDRLTCNTTRQMLDLGELRATKNSRVWRYFATATVTTSAKVFSLKQRTAARRRMNERHGNEPEHREHEETPPWLYRHKPGDTVTTGGGQGALRATVHIGSSWISI